VYDAGMSVVVSFLIRAVWLAGTGTVPFTVMEHVATLLSAKPSLHFHVNESDPAYVFADVYVQD
jgi:hypothetical protein